MSISVITVYCWIGLPTHWVGGGVLMETIAIKGVARKIFGGFHFEV